MDFLKSNLASGGSNKAQPSAQQSSGGFMSRVNEAAGGGRKAEQNEDFVDKGVDFVQEKFLGQGPQDNESAFEQMKDKQIADAIRRQGGFGGVK
ncbi:hypothetical protein CC1G_08820 [Coprinopsis cinerea okayama7|uniref:Uncharacterized protein n=1 Tax=Coprinopsis cinerea (strain Okayama-7 / 130 / ATCC MYA-4618 / FGSC 9003) TaxID=240176 RepID=A8N470_COPC7|nr:hypothetical protein CC1G_08820 [Coprinopsis cinerea okayama7\|eukprot:XP_001829665.1 hypothetical protein CC1G_08820 [Coprinopsis cinerea okayama7\